MNIRKVDGPRTVRGQNGEIISLHDLPAGDTTYWVARRKALVVDAVRGGLISQCDAQARYRISAEEFAGWERAVDSFGVRALKSKAQKTLVHSNRKLLSAAPNCRWHVGSLCVDPVQRKATVHDVPLELKGIEFRILSRLAQERGSVVTRADMLHHLYGEEAGAEMRIINVVVCLLRAKLKEANVKDVWIETVWGRGYVLHAAAGDVATSSQYHV